MPKNQNLSVYRANYH